ncbi:uncharacterized protein LOC118189877 [Stegodyphus dumicola]|uniref:uncharacterized protein LOC118189877 n=1 Tax=Stegodyphus dumicola TaxID=202533 RepID=UPI0015AED7CB|nr:uncharacterized protein LOC118189877 [Stegodyphus dumicola]
MDIAPGTILLLLSSIIGTFGEKEYRCTAQEFEECLRALNAVAQTEELALAVTREELDIVCRKLQHGVRCIDDHSYRCFSVVQRRIFNSVVSESRHVINDLCVPGKLQEDYLRYAPCLKNVSIDIRKCAYQYKRLKNNHGDQFTDQAKDVNDRLKMHCCVFTEFVECQHKHLLRDCGIQAEQFFQRHMDRMSGSLINEHCSLFTHGSNACAFDRNSTHRVFTNRLLYIAVFCMVSAQLVTYPYKRMLIKCL